MKSRCGLAYYFHPAFSKLIANSILDGRIEFEEDAHVGASGASHRIDHGSSQRIVSNRL